MRWPLDKIIITQKFGENPDNYAHLGVKAHEGVDFKTRFIGNSWGWWYDFMGWRNVFAIESGTVEVIYGNTYYGTYIVQTTPSGRKWYYCHLKNAKCKTGDFVSEGFVVGISGASGRTTGPHLHLMTKPYNPNLNNGYKGFEDPMPVLLAHLNIKIARIGSNLSPGDDFKMKLSEYSSGKISCNLIDYIANVNVESGMLTQDEAYALVDRIDPDEKFVVIFYPPNSTSAFYATYYYPKRNCMITTCPGNDPRLLTFEIAHQLQTQYNANRGLLPFIEVVDSNYPSDELITSKLKSIEPYYYILQ